MTDSLVRNVGFEFESMFDTLILNNIKLFFEWLHKKGIYDIKTDSETIEDFVRLFILETYTKKGNETDEGEED